MPEARVETISKKPVLLLRRFDRDGKRRIPFLSAMSMLGSKDNETRSYLEIVDALRQHGAAPRVCSVLFRDRELSRHCAWFARMRLLSFLNHLGCGVC